MIRGGGARFDVVRLALPLALMALVVACGDERAQDVKAPGDAGRGRQILQAYHCGSCHRIPGVAQARGTIGPPLDALGKRVYLAGTLPNSPSHLARWIRTPQALKPGSDMPDLGVDAADARDMAAYLWGLR
jgi:cytochrome c2